MIPIAEPLLGDKELKNVMEAVESGWISSKGKFIPEFEEKFAKYCGVKYGVATSNGTVALHLALEALGIGEGDEVIVPALTFIATANAVTYTGAKPIFVDSHPEYWCTDPEKIEEKITPRTKAIIPVHLYGHPADMDPIMEIAKRYNLYVIEDAAEAHGAEYKGKKAGGLGDVGVFSFYGNKIITTGEGGMLVTNNGKIVERANLLKNQGMDPNRKYWHLVIGYNYRMTNLQAALGVAQLERIEEFIEKKRQIATWYMEMLKNMDGITFQWEAPWAKNVWWMTSIVIDEKKLGRSRDELTAILEEKGIDTRPIFYPIHIMPPYKSSIEFPIAKRISQGGISLPSGGTIGKKDIELIKQELEYLVRKKE